MTTNFENPGFRAPLAPPACFVDAARKTMGGLDFDPCSSKDNNQLVLARRFLDRELVDLEVILNDDWNIPADGRLICCTPAPLLTTRRFLHRILAEYRTGRVNQACVLVTISEAAIRLPWIWDFPVALPFRRLGYRWYDRESGKHRTNTPAQWPFAVYLPPCDTPEQSQAAIVRFHEAFSPFSRIILNELAGDLSWKQHYKKYFGKDFQESR